MQSRKSTIGLYLRHLLLTLCCVIGLYYAGPVKAQECPATVIARPSTGVPGTGTPIQIGSRCLNTGQACTTPVNTPGTCQQSPKDCSAGQEGCYCTCVESAPPKSVPPPPPPKPKTTPPPPPKPKDGGPTTIAILEFAVLVIAWRVLNSFRRRPQGQ